MPQCEEFTSLYVLNMRGDQRTSGELSRREGGKLFGGGSRAPITIVVFVKDPSETEHGQIHYHDIGDYLTREEKLAQLTAFAEGRNAIPWVRITPDDYGDWINQRDPSFGLHIVLGDKKNKAAETVFRQYSRGLETTRDAWCYNASRTILLKNVRRSIDFYNAEVERYASSRATEDVADFVNKDDTQFSWSRSKRRGVITGKRLKHSDKATRTCLYRPFQKQWAYFDRNYNEFVGQLPAIFPAPNSENRAICTTALGTKSSRRSWFQSAAGSCM